MPSFSTLTFFFPNNFDISSSFFLVITLSTITIALFKSPPLIKFFLYSSSTSCKKQKVLEFATSVLNLDNSFNV